jgi:hypothetical protein
MAAVFGQVYGEARPRGLLSGTVTYSGQNANAVWELTDFKPRLDGQIAEGKDGTGDIKAISPHGEKMLATATVVVRAASGGNTEANAKVGLALPSKGTVMNVQCTSLEANMIGLWNLWEAGSIQEAEDFGRVELTLARMRNSTAGTYGVLNAISQT